MSELITGKEELFTEEDIEFSITTGLFQEVSDVSVEYEGSWLISFRFEGDEDFLAWKESQKAAGLPWWIREAKNFDEFEAAAWNLTGFLNKYRWREKGNDLKLRDLVRERLAQTKKKDGL